ncbi:GOLPH3/VPS74 family protein [Haloactinomyces albus]|uniref:Golgi phosphoprotein 3 (GPP34) n=1 Tax=Haloactinomyces albus TaxID=1352928 RepID=A0AAE3ZGM6_9ACTN|nr:GPP34 family phosphoprotein [Haloactinomyces albus]MDR7303705.1 hypothetical protein [Haloactinomyces albus]
MRTNDTASEPWHLATDWFWLAHDDTSGKARVNRTHLGIGLGGALLAELLSAEYMTLTEDLVVPVTRNVPPDVLAHQVFSVARGEPQPLSTRTWLSYLSRTAYEDVGQHLWRRGLIERNRSILWWAPRWLPVDPEIARQPSSRLRSLLIHGEARSAYDAVLVGLSEATGLLQGVLDPEEIPTAQEFLPAVLQTLSPTLRTLLGQMRAAASAAVLSERR